MKTDKKDKELIAAEVKKLLSLKAQLTAAVKEAPKETCKPCVVNQEEVNRLEKEVTEQGNLVRKVKGEKQEKSVIDQEILKLLDLKTKLALAKGEDPNPKKKNKKKK